MSADTGFATAFGAFQDSLGKAYEKERFDFYGRLNEDWRNKKDWQGKWAFGISRISPTAVFQIAAMNLAGTDVEMKYRYQEELNRYQDTYAKFMTSKVGSTADFMRVVIRRYSGNQPSEEEKPKPLNPVEIPDFTDQQRDLGNTVAASLLDLGLLVVLNALFFGGAFFAFLKFDLR
jgi:hypothetical protein